jgi:uncharacterized protein YukE
MTTEITTEILQQIRADIADVKTDISDLKGDMNGRFERLEEHVDQGFERVDDQLLAMMQQTGALFRLYRDHGQRLTAIESGSGAGD